MGDVAGGEHRLRSAATQRGQDVEFGQCDAQLMDVVLEALDDLSYGRAHLQEQGHAVEVEVGSLAPPGADGVVEDLGNGHEGNVAEK